MGDSASHVSPFSGTWYPGSPGELTALLENLWRDSERRTGSFVLPGGVAFVAPHAGLAYSGTVAAAVYRRLERAQPRCVIVAGFAHRGAPPGIWIPEIQSYSTPLGRVMIDAELVGKLTAGTPFGAAAESRICDHSVEIQLPLLQKAAPGARIVPLYVGHLEPQAREEAARRLAEALSPDTVLVASSDLTHYGRDFGFKPFPVDDMVSDRLRDLDDEVIEAAGSLREQLFLDTLRKTEATVCGYEPIALLLATVRALGGEDEIFQETLDYQTSGEITGDFHSSVSYGALAYFPYHALELDREAQAAVLKLARESLGEYQRTGRQRVPELPPSGVASLARHAALFVTLHQDGRLRGCLGRTSAIQSLERAVPELTMAAALEDTRFEPVSTSDTGLDIEVSVLSPLKRVSGRDDFRVNLHGAVLKAKSRQGLLLPQVATERNWTSDQFFQALATKSGVSADVYCHPSTRLYVFRAQVIH